MAEAALVSALEDRPVIFEGLEDVEPADRGRLLRSIEHPPGAHRSWPRPPAPPRSRSASAPCCWSRPSRRPFAERSAGVGGPDRLDRVRRRRRQVPALDDPDRRGLRGRAPVGDRARRGPAGAPSTSTRAPGRRSSSRLGELAARLPPGYKWEDLVVPERQRELLQSISAYLRHRDLVLSDWGYDKSVARTQGLKVLFAGESGTGKTMARAGARGRARPRALPRRPRDDGVASTSVKPRRTSTASSTPPRAPTRSCSSTRPTPSSASAPRSATRTTATRTSRSPTCCSRWRATRAR